MKVTIPAVETNLDEQFVKDIMVTAVEGGINYWACLTSVERDADLNVLSIEGHDAEDEETEFKADLSTILLGLQMCVTEGRYVDAIRNSDASELDADDADLILQMGVFGEVVYG